MENILSPYEMQEMLYTLREHSMVLSCGRWDYASSVIIIIIMNIIIYGFGLYKKYYHFSLSFLLLLNIHSHILFTSLCVYLL
jgi:hypothetical protein